MPVTAPRHDRIRRWVLSLLCALVAIPTLTSVHLRCLVPTAPAFTIDEVWGDASSWLELSAMSPSADAEDVYLDTMVSFRVNTWPHAFTDIEVLVTDTDHERPPLELILVEERTRSETHRILQYRLPEVLQPDRTYEVEVTVCASPEGDPPTCQAAVWGLATSDIGQPLEPGKESVVRGYALALGDVALLAPTNLPGSYLAHYLVDVDPLLLGTWPNGDGVTMVSTLTTDGNEPYEPDPCLVTLSFEGSGEGDPPVYRLEGIDLTLEGGSLRGGIWDLQGELIPAPDLSRAWLQDVSATFDTRLFDQAMIADGASTCEPPTICAPDDLRSLRVPALGWQLQRQARDQGWPIRDDWYEGYTCDQLGGFLGLDCFECPDGSGPFCSEVIAGTMVLPAIDAPVPARTAEEIAEDPEC